MTRVLIFTVSIAVVLAAHLESQMPNLNVRIISPTEDSYVSGPTALRAQVEPAGADAVVTFYVNGRLVCHVVAAPYECRWDAGATITKHHIRAAAVSASGGPAPRAVATVVTRDAGFIDSVDVELVEVTVTVTDDAGRFAMGLPKSAFHVFEDGQPQAITHFVSENVPLDLVLAVDVSSSMRPSMAKTRTSVKEFLSAIAPGDQVTLVGFNDTMFPVIRRSTDAAARLTAVDRLSAWGGTSLYDVVITGAGMLDRGTGRKAMLVFSDGEDQGSRASLSDAVARLEASSVSLSVIGLGRGMSSDALKKTMHRLAAPTGGRAILSEDINDLRGAFTSLLEELSHQYLLGYAPTNTKRDGSLRHLKVEVDGRHRVRAREGYRARVEN